MRKTLFIVILVSIVFASAEAPALQRGAILYHTSKGDNIYGRTDVLELPCSTLELTHRDMKSGHVGLYIGNERIIHAVAPTVEETASENFIPQSDLDEGCRYLGAKVPVGFDAWPEEDVDRLILLAREQVGKYYDIQFRHQKGRKIHSPASASWSTSMNRWATTSPPTRTTPKPVRARTTHRPTTVSGQVGVTGRVRTPLRSRWSSQDSSIQW